MRWTTMERGDNHIALAITSLACENSTDKRSILRKRCIDIILADREGINLKEDRYYLILPGRTVLLPEEEGKT